MDDRVVLPLAKTREAAQLLCRTVCAGGPHHRACLIPDLARHALLLAEPELVDVVLPDCRDGKCRACPGCACTCHLRCGVPSPAGVACWYRLHDGDHAWAEPPRNTRPRATETVVPAL